MATRSQIGTSLGKCITNTSATGTATFTIPASMNPANLPRFTVAIWCYPTLAPQGRLFELNSATTSKGFNIALTTAGEVQGLVGHSTTAAQSFSGNSVVRRHQWHRIVMTWDDTDSRPKIYVNGKFYPNTTGTAKNGTRGTVAGDTGYLINRTGVDRAFFGMVDDFCIANRVWTQAEISADAVLNNVPTSGLLLWWKFEEASGTLQDSSPVPSVTGTPSNIFQNTNSLTITSRIART